MSALTSFDLASLRAGLSAGLNAQTIQYKLMANGTAGTGVDLTAVVTSETRTEVYNERGKVQIVRQIVVRPVETETMVLGDLIVYGGEDWTIKDINGTDIRRITAVINVTNGNQSNDRFRAEGP